jgi:hypothetical protein
MYFFFQGNNVCAKSYPPKLTDRVDLFDDRHNHFVGGRDGRADGLRGKGKGRA